MRLRVGIGAVAFWLHWQWLRLMTFAGELGHGRVWRRCMYIFAKFVLWVWGCIASIFVCTA